MSTPSWIRKSVISSYPRDAARCCWKKKKKKIFRTEHLFVEKFLFHMLADMNNLMASSHNQYLKSSRNTIICKTRKGKWQRKKAYIEWCTKNLEYIHKPKRDRNLASAIETTYLYYTVPSMVIHQTCYQVHLKHYIDFNVLLDMHDYRREERKYPK